MRQECFVEYHWFGECRALYEVILVLEPLCRQDSWSRMESPVSLHRYALYRMIFKTFPSQNCSSESLEWNCVPSSVQFFSGEKLKSQGQGNAWAVWSSETLLKAVLWNSLDQPFLEHTWRSTSPGRCSALMESWEVISSLEYPPPLGHRQYSLASQGLSNKSWNERNLSFSNMVFLKYCSPWTLFLFNIDCPTEILFSLHELGNLAVVFAYLSLKKPSPTCVWVWVWVCVNPYGFLKKIFQGSCHP